MAISGKILIHNRYAAEHGQLFGWSMIIDQILIHNRYAAEHAFVVTVKFPDMKF